MQIFVLTIWSVLLIISKNWKFLDIIQLKGGKHLIKTYEKICQTKIRCSIRRSWSNKNYFKRLFLLEIFLSILYCNYRTKICTKIDLHRIYAICSEEESKMHPIHLDKKKIFKNINKKTGNDIVRTSNTTKLFKFSLTVKAWLLISD